MDDLKVLFKENNNFANFFLQKHIFFFFFFHLFEDMQNGD